LSQADRYLNHFRAIEEIPSALESQLQNAAFEVAAKIKPYQRIMLVTECEYFWNHRMLIESAVPTSPKRHFAKIN